MKRKTNMDNKTLQFWNLCLTNDESAGVQNIARWCGLSLWFGGICAAHVALPFGPTRGEIYCNTDAQIQKHNGLFYIHNHL